jgi:sugar phosphate isomerase/epimerase
VISQFSMDRTAPWSTRAAAAAAAGFDGIGLWVRDAPDVDPAEIVDTLAELGIVLSELEALSGWASSGPDYDLCRELETAAYAVADATGARHMQVWGSYEGDLDDAARAFGEVCDRAGDHGLLIALEFLPFTNIPDARTAMEIVERAGRPNGGLCVDVWHHERGARSLEQLRAMPPEWVVGVQLDDGAATPVDPDYYTDCVQNRVPPGEGEFDLVTFLRILREIGADAPLDLEVLSADTGSQPPAEVAAHLYAATAAVRDEAWGSNGG